MRSEELVVEEEEDGRIGLLVEEED